MESILKQLYHTIVFHNRDAFTQTPDYQEAMSEWEACQKGDALALEDGAALREAVWGRLAFSFGLRLGLQLSQELNQLEEETL